MTPIDLSNGYFTVPPGKLVNAVTWLEMRRRPSELLDDPLRLVAATSADAAICQALFAEIGTPWLWSGAYGSAERELSDTFFAVDDTERRVGVVEVRPDGADGVEISYFGLVSAATGTGLGRRMMAAVLDRLWRRANRVWLHTCNFDHPAALRFYRSCGFVPYASGFEIMDDPRLDGRLPRDAAPHVALIERA